MGYSGAVYLLQEVCNALFDALFNILPLATEMDQVAATPTRAEAALAWNDEAEAALDGLVAREPRISSGLAAPSASTCSRPGSNWALNMHRNELTSGSLRPAP